MSYRSRPCRVLVTIPQHRSLPDRLWMAAQLHCRESQPVQKPDGSWTEENGLGIRYVLQGFCFLFISISTKIGEKKYRPCGACGPCVTNCTSVYEPVKLTDDVDQKKQNILNNSVHKNKSLQNKENLLRFLYRGKPLRLHQILRFLWNLVATSLLTICHKWWILCFTLGLVEKENLANVGKQL